MEQRADFLGAMRAGWWIAPIVLVAALATVAFLNLDAATPVYQVSATLAAAPHHTVKNENQILRSMEMLERRTTVLTLSRIPSSGSIRRKAAERLETPQAKLRDYRVRSIVLPGTHLIRVSVTGPDPKTAAEFGTAVIRAAVEDVSTFYPVFALRIMEGPSLPDQPVDPGTTRHYAVAGLLGLFLGACGAYGVGMVSVTGAERRAKTPHARVKSASEQWA